jgi:hypothetical protein
VLRFVGLRVENSLEEGDEEEEEEKKKVRKLTPEQIEGKCYKKVCFRISSGFSYFRLS